jgi:type IV pilus assembly protein PilF
MLLLVGLLLAGCATETEPERVDLVKASDFNAQLGVAYMQQGNNEWALNKLEKALSQNPDNGRAHHYIAELYRRVDDYAKAEEHFNRAMELLPNDMPLRENYGVYLCDRGDAAQGLRYLYESLNSPFNTAPAGTHENLGQCAMATNDLATAEKQLRTALQLDPKRPRALLTMAQIAHRNKQYLRARSFFQRYLELAPQTPENPLTGIRIEEALGNRDTVASYSLLLRGKFPDSDEAQELMQAQPPGVVQ